MKLLLTIVLLTTTALGATVQQVSKAIARAEGFYVNGSVPNRCHNPADIRASKTAHYAGQVGLDHHGYVIFKNDTAGWAALEYQINRIVAGNSKFYSVNMTLLQLSKKYATSPTWAKNVSKNLGVTPATTIAVILDIPPAFNPAWENQHEASLDLFGSRPVAGAKTKTQRAGGVRAGAANKEPTAYKGRASIPWLAAGVERAER